MGLDDKQINGSMHSWGSIEARVATQTVYGFTSISFSDERTRQFVYGMGKSQAPRGRTRGRYVPGNVKYKGPVSTMDALRELLAATGPNQQSYGDTEFHAEAQLVELDETPSTIECLRCVYVKTLATWEEGDSVLMEEIECSTMMVVRNGLTLAQL